MGGIPLFLAGACAKMMGARLQSFFQEKHHKAPIKLVHSSIQKLWGYIQVIPFQ